MDVGERLKSSGGSDLFCSKMDSVAGTRVVECFEAMLREYPGGPAGQDHVCYRTKAGLGPQGREVWNNLISWAAGARGELILLCLCCLDV